MPEHRYKYGGGGLTHPPDYWPERRRQCEGCHYEFHEDKLTELPDGTEYCERCLPKGLAELGLMEDDLDA